ncbi:uncharacterized protein LOC141595126 [Silene latifolia]|uniref:uncharacterized protein LOC141595126 n=1 Tax=Silene latifolia TaxID=37657 RepID=UPI003D78070A
MENEFAATVKAQIQSGHIHGDSKLARFDGMNYTRWKDRMVFLLTVLKIFYVLESDLTPIPDPLLDDTDLLKKERSKRKEDELMCRGYVLNSLSDRLYDLYRNLSSPRDIWNALEMKYKNEKRGTDKFLAMKYFEFFMTDNKSTIMDQVHELQILVSRLNELEIKIHDALQIGAILAKLPPSWNDFRKKFLHSNESTTIEQFQTHLKMRQETV